MHLRFGLALVVAAFLVLVPSASAATSMYPPDAGDRDFNAGPGSWTAEDNVNATALCLPPLTCPSLSSAHSATGGSDDSGHLRTSLTGVLALLSATSEGIWSSGAFVYDGVDGAVPDEVELRMSRGGDLTELFEVLSTDPQIRIVLRNVTDDTEIEVQPLTSLSGVGAFGPTAPIAINPADLHLGDSYRLVITSHFDTGVQLLPSGWIGYDDIALVAETNGGSGGDGGGSGGGGQGGAGGSGGDGGGAGGAGAIGNVAKTGGAITGKAILRGNRLVVKVKCKTRKVKRCKARYDARFKKRGKKISNTKRTKIKSGKSKKVKLRVKKAKFLRKIERKGKVVVRQRVKLGKRKATRYKRVEVKTRG